MWSAICSAIGYVLEFFNNLVSNYAVALLLFALVFKLLLFPFSIKQQKNTVRQVKLRPKEMAIRKKYKGRTDQASRQRMQQEIMEMQQREGFSPFGGCLPLLLQLPIMFALYNVIRNPLQYIMHLSEGLVEAIKNACISHGLGEKVALDQIAVTQHLKENFTAVGNLIGSDYANEFAGIAESDLPNFNAFGDYFNLAEQPSFATILWVVPFLTFIAQFFSMKITRKLTNANMPMDEQAADAMKSMKIMDFMMPLMSLFFAFSFPAILGVYWIYQSVLGIGQQYLLRVFYPFPELTEEDYKAAEREIMGRGKKKKKKKNVDGTETVVEDDRPRRRSLHYIDADDDEMPAETKKKTSEEPAEVVSSPIEAAPLKDDAVRPVKKKKTKKEEAPAQTEEVEVKPDDTTDDKE